MEQLCPKNFQANIFPFKRLEREDCGTTFFKLSCRFLMRFSPFLRDTYRVDDYTLSTTIPCDGDNRVTFGASMRAYSRRLQRLIVKVDCAYSMFVYPG